MKKIVIGILLSIMISVGLQAHNLRESIESDHRSTESKARDIYRNPFETLNFFRITPEMTVVELSPGRGWYTEILAMYMYDYGKLIAAPYNPSLGGYAERSFNNYKAKLDSDETYKKVKISYIFENIAEDNSVDAVLTFRNLHNWLKDDAKNAKLIFNQSYSALKPGGLFGIVEHRAEPGTLLSDMQKSGYVTEDLTIKLARQAGFELIDRSEVNSNIKDTKDYPTGVWTLPPTYYLKDLDRDKFKSIGESDRMTLLFQKPL
jgi:predicted methyltransferase